MNFNIEKGIIPVITAKSGESKFDVVPLAQMIIGDSIFIPTSFARKENVASYVSLYSKRNGVKVISRSCEGGCRIFKIENK